MCNVGWKASQTGNEKLAKSLPTTSMSVPYEQKGMRAEGIGAPFGLTRWTGWLLSIGDSEIVAIESG